MAGLLGQPQPVNPIPLLSSYSTLWALLSLWLLYRILDLRFAIDDLREDAAAEPSFVNRKSKIVNWLICAFYATTYFFWYYATTTEQYSSAIAHTLAIVYVYLLWRRAEQESRGAGAQGCNGARERASRRAEERRRGDQFTHHASRITITPHLPPATRYLLLLAFLCGLSLAHMLTVALIVPPLVAVVLWQAPHLLRRPRLIAGAVVAAALPLVSYGYVWLRGVAHPEWWGSGDWATASAWFWSFVSTAQGREELGWGFEPGRAFWGGGFPELMWQELGVALILGVVGIALLDRKLATLLYSTLALYLAFCWAYRYGNWFQVILPVYPLILIGAATLIHHYQFTIHHSPFTIHRSPFSSSFKRPLQFLPLFALILLILWRTSASLPAADSRSHPGDSGPRPRPHPARPAAAAQRPPLRRAGRRARPPIPQRHLATPPRRANGEQPCRCGAVGPGPAALRHLAGRTSATRGNAAAAG